MNSHLAFKFNMQQSNLLALAVDFFLCNVGDLTPRQEQLLNDLLLELDITLTDLEEQIQETCQGRIKDIQDNVILVDFSDNIN